MTVFNNSTAMNDSVFRDKRLTEQLIESFLAVYIMPVIIAVGTVGNLTSLAVLLRRRMRRTSVYLYLTVLALADVSVLYVSAFKTWIRLVRASSSGRSRVRRPLNMFKIIYYYYYCCCCSIYKAPSVEKTRIGAL